MPYELWIRDEARNEIGRLPGHMRQRVRRAVQNLASEPRPPQSRPMKASAGLDVEVRRIRLERWRLIYVVDEAWSEVGVLAVRRRPPYDYRDLSELLAGLDG